MSNKSSYEDLQNQIRKLKTPDIEVWDNKYADREYEIDLTISEFTCICPKTGLPDFAVVKINYSPNKICLELKSLKMYFHFYRSIGIFHEHLANKVLDDIVKACKPRWAKCEIEMNPRGGISTVVKVQYNLNKR